MGIDLGRKATAKKHSHTPPFFFWIRNKTRGVFKQEKLKRMPPDNASFEEVQFITFRILKSHIECMLNQTGWAWDARLSLWLDRAIEGMEAFQDGSL